MSEFNPKLDMSWLQAGLAEFGSGSVPLEAGATFDKPHDPFSLTPPIFGMPNEKQYLSGLHGSMPT
jgi:hypothetical protein